MPTSMASLLGQILVVHAPAPTYKQHLVSAFSLIRCSGKSIFAPAEEKKVLSRVGRRAALLSFIALPGFAVVSSPVTAADVEPLKTNNLSIEEIKGIIERDIAEGQYFVTGNLTRSVYAENCRFRDPSTDVVGLGKYLRAVSILFDPEVSEHKLISAEVTAPNKIRATWILGGYLKFPWRPKISTIEGTTEYTVGPDGLIVFHEEVWNISAFTALIESFTPGFFNQS
eukprot:TRINITY_DN14727_c0_g1_i1.p1 TRINITY_DN14727_c0_g1~~TRINITY_DN14727_c0_g1_i1.p1  ORF type:complete len:243 (-),score=23.19 TRINITY_DN14727_c0_g1_i1:80-760(-)